MFPKEYITPEQLAAARGVERQQASRAYKEGKRTIPSRCRMPQNRLRLDRGNPPQEKCP